MVQIVAEFLLNLWRSDQVHHLLVPCEGLGAREEVADHFLPGVIRQTWKANILPPSLSKYQNMSGHLPTSPQDAKSVLLTRSNSHRNRPCHNCNSSTASDLIWFLLQIVMEGKKIFSKSSVEDSRVTTVQLERNWLTLQATRIKAPRMLRITIPHQMGRFSRLELIGEIHPLRPFWRVQKPGLGLLYIHHHFHHRKTHYKAASSDHHAEITGATEAFTIHLMVSATI